MQLTQDEIRVTHGPNDSQLKIIGLTVAKVRRHLATAFNIPAHAYANVNGIRVDPHYRLEAGDHVDFLVRDGQKGALEPEELARLAALEERLAKVQADQSALAVIASNLARIANHFDPPPPDKVDSTFVAEKLGCGAARVAQMALRGEIPSTCIVSGTGQGKPWKFHRIQIEQWIERR